MTLKVAPIIFALLITSGNVPSFPEPATSIESHNTFLEKSAGGYPYGIDISKWQFDLMQKLTDPGFSFIICKATEGHTDVDPRFKENWKAIQDRKLVRGAYHFYLANGTPVEQADHYLDTLNNWRSFWQKDKPSPTLPPIVDIERRGVSPNVHIPTLQADLLLFLGYVEAKTHRKPIIYTDLSFANKYLDNPNFAEYTLWVARYTKDPSPQLPKTWKGKGAKIWQKSNRYVLNSRWTDFNIFLGHIDELRNGLVEVKKPLPEPREVIGSSSDSAQPPTL